MERHEAAPDVRVETITGDELYKEIYNPETREPDARFIPREEGGVFEYSPCYRDIDAPGTFYSVVREHGTIVGFAKVRESPHEPDVMWRMSISVDKDRKGEGISRTVLEEVFAYVKARGMRLHPSMYSAEGEERIKHQIERLAAEYGVQLA